MKRKVASSVAAILIGLLLTGCQAETTESGLPTDFDFSETETDTDPVDVITIWAPSSVSNSLTGVAGAFEKEYEVSIQFTNIELAEIESRLQSGNYPDIFFGTHSWTAGLVEQGAVSKINVGVLGSRIPEGLTQAFSFEGDYYGVPVSEQHVALVCNSDLVEQQPSLSTLEDLGLGLALDPQLADPYHLYPFMSSFGLSLQDPEQIDFSADNGYEYANWMADEGSALFNLDSDYQSVLNSFNSSEIGCWLTGPWALSSVNSELQQSLVVFEVPPAGEFEASPLVDVAGFFVSSTSDDPVFANRLVLEEFTRSASQLAIARSLAGIPAVETDDELLNQFGATAVGATPTPAGGVIDQLWPILGSTQADLIRNETSSVEIWRGFVEQFDALSGNQD